MSTTTQKQSTPLEYKVLTLADIQKEMRQTIDRLKDTIKMPYPLCQLMLQDSQWDSEKAAMKFYDAGGQLKAELCSNYDPAKPNDKDASSKYSSESGNCKLCETDKIPVSGLNCRHLFCNDCWSAYIQVKVMDEATSQIICPGTNCNVLLDRETTLRMNKAEDVLNQYEKWETRSYIVSNRATLKPCIGQGCANYATISISRKNCGVKCSCGVVFCWNCSNTWHEPINCDLLERWMNRCEADLQNSAWIRVFTKACPKCKVPIEKNQGCNHMTCRASGCRYEFCWVCMGDWKEHKTGSPFNCTRFSPDKVKQEEQSVLERERFNFYASRYDNHQQSHRFEQNLRQHLEEKMRQFMDIYEGPFENAAFFREAVDALGQGRRILQYSYVFLFYLDDQSSGVIATFEQYQQNLEQYVEALSNLLEQNNIKSRDVEDLKKLKTGIIKQTNYAKSQCEVMLKHVYEGATRKEWHYNAGDVKVATMEGMNG